MWTHMGKPAETNHSWQLGVGDVGVECQNPQELSLLGSLLVLIHLGIFTEL